MGSEAGCGGSLPGSLGRWDRATCSWRTAQRSLFGDWEEFSGIWPRWGMLRAGVCWEQKTPAGVMRTRWRITSAKESGLLRSVSQLLEAAGADGDGKARDYFGDGSLSLRGSMRLLAGGVPGTVRLQTPVADDAVSREGGKWNSRGEPKLSAEVKLLAGTLRLPTPCAMEPEKDLEAHARKRALPRSERGGGNGENLATAVRMLEGAVLRLSTPQAHDAHGGRNLNDDMALLALRFTTPTCRDMHSVKKVMRGSGSLSRGQEMVEPLGVQAWKLAGCSGGQLNPEFVEWLMGWPIGWTGFGALEMGRFRRWCALHGKRWEGGDHE